MSAKEYVDAIWSSRWRDDAVIVLSEALYDEYAAALGADTKASFVRLYCNGPNNAGPRMPVIFDRELQNGGVLMTFQYINAIANRAHGEMKEAITKAVRITLDLRQAEAAG